MPMKEESGIIQFLVLALVGLALIVGVVVALVLGVDRVYFDQSGKTMFADDAKITEIRKEVQKKKDQLLEDLMPEQADVNSPAAAKGNPDKRLDQLQDKLNSDVQ